jgi:hypothetical protein
MIMNAPAPWVRCIFSFKKMILAITIKIRLISVMKVVIVVDDPANLGILIRALFIRMKENRAISARIMEIMNLQLSTSPRKLSN